MMMKERLLSSSSLHHSSSQPSPSQPFQQEEEADLSATEYPPTSAVNFFSVITFTWAWPILQRGHRRALTVRDLYRMPSYMESRRYMKEIGRCYESEAVRGRSHRIMRAVTSACWKRFFVPILYMRIALLVFQIVRPILVRQLLLSVSDVFVQESVGNVADEVVEVWFFRFASFSSVSAPLCWGTSLAIVSLLMAVLNHMMWFFSVQTALTGRGGVIGLVSNKAMTIHMKHRQEYTSGKISNLTSVDADGLMNFLWSSVFELFTAPLLIIILMSGLVWQVGWIATSVGVGTLCLSLVCTSWLANKLSYYQEEIMQKSDERVTKFSELLMHLKLIRLMSWQFAFADVVEDVRKKQVSLLYKSNSISAITRVLGTASPLFVSFASFAVYVHMGEVLDAATTFTALMLFQILREPLSRLPEAISLLVKCMVSLDRLQGFLNCEDQEHYVELPTVRDSDSHVILENVTCDWGSELSQEHGNGKGNATLTESSLNNILVQPMTNSSSVPVLSNINLRVTKGELVMVCGRVGSGKSSLLSCMLGEMHLQCGSVRVTAKRGYTQQSAFLQSATLRENITFGSCFDSSFYQQVLTACALDQDISRFPDLDQTVVGEHGIVLSGGQKARLQLARAIYSRADVYFLEDALAAVDSSTALHLFEHVLSEEKGILRGRTRILVTHQLQFAPRCSSVILMEKGRILHQGTYAELQALGVDFRAIVESVHIGSAEERSKRDELAAAEQLHYVPLLSPQNKSQSCSTNHTSSQALLDPPLMTNSLSRQSYDDSSTLHHIKLQQSTESQLRHTTKPSSSAVMITHESLIGHKDLTDESLNSDRMSKEIYRDYFVSGASGMIWLLTLALVMLSQAGVVFSDFLLALLSTTGVEENALISRTIALGIQKLYVQTYLIVIVVASLLLIARSTTIAIIAVRASARFHRRLLWGLLRAPQTFHDTTPSGRIINRIGKDMDMLDTQMPSVIQDMLSCGVAVGGTLMLTVLVIPLSLPLLAFLFWLYIRLQNIYKPSSVALKRLESVTRSPIYQHVGNACNGLATFRAFQHVHAVAREIVELQHRLDLNTRIYFYSFVIHRYMGMRLETIGALFVWVASVVSTVLLPTLGPGLVGLTITTSLTLSSVLHWLIRQRTEFEVQLNGVERILEYAYLQPEEDDEHFNAGLAFERQARQEHYAVNNQVFTTGIKEKNEEKPATLTTHQTDPSSNTVLIPPDAWPWRGEIRYHNVSISYRPPPEQVIVLHNLDATIKAGEKVGCVGRTGGGKSTMSLALFRIMDTTDGYITIDSLPLHRIPLHILRSRLSLVPQDTVVFSRSIRDNLDPFHRYSDSQLWHALDQVELSNLVHSLGGLSTPVSGQSLSAGQGQLLQLARALLRDSKIIVLDEASAQLDLQADVTIKKVINKAFRNSTVLTIAHRLNSVLGSDRILVLDAGRLQEFDSPARLLHSQGFLAKLMADATDMTSAMSRSTNTVLEPNKIIHSQEPQSAEGLEECKELDPLLPPSIYIRSIT